ncbi:MAG: hypothetical protein SPJ62_10815 [Inconstantimicrobium porci]|uniref:Uncharacterized protein n=1 Tax=Inconstantimicrobium porci TaxID=2652291 RepID=A0A7X2SZW8_9CLOT|nr:hypothetical protein [Inconstantimicrobium porci]MDD6770254.1 hypothetical protein [Inconstantimicrobium porci]MDY5912470.1 hypothetical protein [Inconstantimicrobium porci]MSR89894.1 hypothetical protein [Inconstantimicrobium porci]
MNNKQIDEKYKDDIDQAVALLEKHPEYEIMIRRGFETEYSQRGVSLVIFLREDKTAKTEYTEKFETELSFTFQDNDPVEEIMNIICKKAGR